MDINLTVARNIKAAREQKKLTLDAAAKKTGVSRSMLAQIEKGDVNPTISVLWRIANGYKISFTSLVERHEEPALVIRRESITPLEEEDGKYSNYPIFPFQEDKLFETYLIEIQPEGFLQAEAHLPGTEEYITVFDGEVTIKTGSDIFVLRRGDSVRFYADKDHSYKNTGAETARLNMIIYYNK